MGLIGFGRIVLTEVESLGLLVVLQSQELYLSPAFAIPKVVAVWKLVASYLVRVGWRNVSILHER